jgi:MFS family permease
MAGTAQPERAREDRPWGARAFRVALAVLALIVLGFLAAAFLPRWWSHRVGNQVDGRLSVGIVLGLFYGFVFTLLPLAAARIAFRKRRPWKTWAVLAGLAVLLAAPNLLTLGIVVGSGNAAHAGERTLDVDAPGFRYATLAGAVGAAALMVAIEYLIRSRRRSERRLQDTRRRLETAQRPPGEPPSGSAPPPANS